MFFETLKYRLNPKNRHDIKLQKELFAELKKFGFNFHDHRQFNCDTFKEKDKQVVPILISYIDRFESEGCRMQYLSALGVKGFNDATEYLISKYKHYLRPEYDQMQLNVVSQTLAKICDLRFLNDYFEILSSDVTIDACYLVQMLGKLKVEAAIPYLIKLFDCANIIPEKWVGTVLESSKYYVSQCAIEALGKFKKKELNKYIEKFLNPSELQWISFSEESKNLLKSTYKDYIKAAQKAMC